MPIRVVPLVCIETALPAKFAATIREALGRDPDRPAAYADLESRPQRFESLPADAARVKAYIAAHAGAAGVSGGAASARGAARSRHAMAMNHQLQQPRSQSVGGLAARGVPAGDAARLPDRHRGAPAAAGRLRAARPRRRLAALRPRRTDLVVWRRKRVLRRGDPARLGGAAFARVPAPGAGAGDTGDRALRLSGDPDRAHGVDDDPGIAGLDRGRSHGVRFRRHGLGIRRADARRRGVAPSGRQAGLVPRALQGDFCSRRR